MRSHVMLICTSHKLHISNTARGCVQGMMSQLVAALGPSAELDMVATWAHFAEARTQRSETSGQMTRAGLQSVLSQVDKRVSSTAGSLDWAAAARRIRNMT